MKQAPRWGSSSEPPRLARRLFETRDVPQEDVRAAFGEDLGAAAGSIWKIAVGVLP
jgi:hypothetical protein